jgi:hypothetical protein
MRGLVVAGVVAVNRKEDERLSARTCPSPLRRTGASLPAGAERKQGGAFLRARDTTDAPEVGPSPSSARARRATGSHGGLERVLDPLRHALAEGPASGSTLAHRLHLRQCDVLAGLPRWTLQNRPLVDWSRPATALPPRLVDVYFFAPSWRKSVSTLVRQSAFAPVTLRESRRWEAGSGPGPRAGKPSPPVSGA